MINVTARRTELLEAHRDPQAADDQRGEGNFLGMATELSPFLRFINKSFE